ncbi:MAG: SH3 domain-containing protein [Coriobacteriales bacterium]
MGETVEKKPTKKPARKPAAEKKEGEKTTAAARYAVDVPLLNIREKASLSSSIIGTLERGAEVQVSTRTPQGFGKLEGRDGYIKLEYVKALEGEQP